MSANVWSSRADVLNDLKEVTGGIAGFSNLDDYVAVGERPPPDRRESIDEDELKYHFGGLASGAVGNTAPDLDGISQMLQLVNEDSLEDNNQKTIFRNTLTDEIRISKLNPNVTEFVPSGFRPPQVQHKQRTPKKTKLKSPTKLDHNNQRSAHIEYDETIVSHANKICDIKRLKDEAKISIPSDPLTTANNGSIINESKGKENNNNNGNSTNSLNKATVSNNDISLDKKVDISNMKSEEIEEMKLKIKSKIIDSSGDSMQHRKEKNVAMAALLKLYAPSPAAPEKPVKLMTPDYFEATPAKVIFEAKEEPNIEVLTEVETLEETPEVSTSKDTKVYKDPFVEESIAKVNDWFDNAGSPKPKPSPAPVAAPPPAAAPVVPPVHFKDVLSFKKKNVSSLSINSPKSETSSEKKKQYTAFVPSTYADDLLLKYEKNAKTQVPPKEDWTVKLERQLKEKDIEIRKKIRDKQDGKSPILGGGN